MPDELEKRLERALAAMPGPSAEASDRALRAAVAALPPAADGRWARRQRLLAAAAVCAVAFVFGGVTLAATGGSLPLVGSHAAPTHTHHHPRPGAAGPPRRPVLPRGSIAFAATAAGRAWLATSAGAALRGRPLTALALSPGTVYVLEARGGTVRAVRASSGRTAFVRRVAGTAIAAAWAPAGIRIAYVVRTAGGDRLYDMYGNGEHPYLVAARTDGRAPSWRWDSTAFAYVRGDGRVAVHDAINGATSLVRRSCGIGRAAAVAFAPYGGLLAIADRDGRIEVVDTLRHARPFCTGGLAAGVPSIAWLGPRQLLVGAGAGLAHVVLRGPGGVDMTALPGRVAGLAAAAGTRIALALRDPAGGVRVVEAAAPRFSEQAQPLRILRTLLRLERAAGPVTLAWQ